MADDSIKTFWYSPLFYMAVFGLLGGLIGWGGGEVVFVLLPNRQEEFQEVMSRQNEITEAMRRGQVKWAKGKALLAELYRANQHNPYFRTAEDGLLSDAEKTRRFEELSTRETVRSTLCFFTFMASVAVAIAFFLAIADQVVGRNWRGVVVSGSVAVVLGLLGGVIGGVCLESLYGTLGGGTLEEGIGRQMLARSIAWSGMGLFLAVAPGIILRSWKRCAIGVAGGFLGGLLGGILFDPIALATQSGMASRFVGILSIGLLSGLGTGLIEKAAKTGWLRVVAGLIAGKQFILYKNPTCIGSSPQCEIYLFKDRRVGPRHALIHIVRGGYEIEDLRSPTGTIVNGRPVARRRLHQNDRVQIGSTILQFQEKTRAT